MCVWPVGSTVGTIPNWQAKRGHVPHTHLTPSAAKCMANHLSLGVGCLCFVGSIGCCRACQATWNRLSNAAPQRQQDAGCLPTQAQEITCILQASSVRTKPVRPLGAAHHALSLQPGVVLTEQSASHHWHAPAAAESSSAEGISMRSMSAAGKRRPTLAAAGFRG